MNNAPSTSAPLGDRELVMRALAGSSSAFEPIMRRYNQRLFRTVRAIVLNDSDAEDVLQDAYMAAFRALHKFEGRARLSTWLTRIAINAAVTHVRRRPRQQTLLSKEDMELEAIEDPEQTAARAQLREALEQSIDALPEPYRLVFMLREVEGLSTAETAICLGLDEPNVRKRLQRARAALRRDLAKADASIAFAFAGERCNRIVRRVLAKMAQAD